MLRTRCAPSRSRRQDRLRTTASAETETASCAPYTDAVYGDRVQKLPIDDVLPQLVAAVRDRQVAVLVAPPGAGKTTRVPGALLDAGAITGEIIVLQPRRL